LTVPAQGDVIFAQINNSFLPPEQCSITSNESQFNTFAQMSYQQLDHTIFVVGWGVDKKKNEPYWIARNSYGDEWGMTGDFLVRRGRNDYGIESELSGYDVELL